LLLRGCRSLAMLEFCMPRLRTTLAPAKVNLTLRVLGRRADGLHDLASLVAFADVGDELALQIGAPLDLAVEGPMAAMSGAKGDNLVLKAACALGERIEGLRLGRFVLDKRLPVGAGLGGGSADAAAALRLIARANELAADDNRIFETARAVGADVPACLEPRARLMHGIGDELSAPINLPELDAVLVFPGIGLETRDVFRAFAPPPELRARYSEAEIPEERDALIEFLARQGNDLERAATSIAPFIAEAKSRVERAGRSRLVRMTGSGSAVFAIYDTGDEAADAAAKIQNERAEWWVAATTLT
jgi:4-diphosphocytidyl-2-C-methyl-D-erythritol kinase